MTSRAALLLVLVTLAASAAHAQQSPNLLAPFGWFADMAGSCWSGTLPDGKTNDTQCYSVQYGRHMRGTIKVVHEGRPAEDFEGDSVYAWNAQANRVQYTFWADDGSYGTGEMYAEGDYLIWPPANPDSPGAIRLLWTRIDADSFLVTRERRDGKAWTKFFEVTYRRS